MAVLNRSRQAAKGQAGTTASPRPRRRNAPLALVGILLVVACAALSAVGWLQAGNRQPVLALARPVTAGQVLTSADLQVVRVSASGPVSLVPASQEAAVVGRTAAATLPAGSLLTSAEIGTAPLTKGQALLGVAVKPGQYPPDLTAGQTVDVLATPSGSSSGTSGSGSAASSAALPTGQAIVLSVTPDDSQGDTVIELEVSQDALPQVAAAATSGQIALATVGSGG
jgi:SAF domain